MDIKKIISIGVSLVLAGASVFMIYTNFFAKPSAPEVKTGGVGAALPASSILPYGNTLDFRPISSYNPGGRLFNYPVVDPAEVGLTIEEFIKGQAIVADETLAATPAAPR